MALTVETWEIVCAACTNWFEVTLWPRNRGSIMCPACGGDPFDRRPGVRDALRVHCDDKDKEIARLGRVIAGLRGALNSRRPAKRQLRKLQEKRA